jgi:hypothetical protein
LPASRTLAPARIPWIAYRGLAVEIQMTRPAAVRRLVAGSAAASLAEGYPTLTPTGVRQNDSSYGAPRWELWSTAPALPSPVIGGLGGPVGAGAVEAITA